MGLHLFGLSVLCVTGIVVIKECSKVKNPKMTICSGVFPLILTFLIFLKLNVYASILKSNGNVIMEFYPL
ncbi:hypothetical protein MXB_2621 [Myxobolus squamalis]|nr:hypothetical protein MXB_2621 [Myxobolus squamalis]